MSYQLQGWQPDPFGSHEFRFFSDDGKPTLLVRDGDTRTYDPPPATGCEPVVLPTAPVENFAPGAVTEVSACNVGAPHNAGFAVKKRRRVVDRLLETSSRRAGSSTLVFPVHPSPRLTTTAKVAYGVVLIAMLGSAVALGVLHLNRQATVHPQSSPTSSSPSTSPPTSGSSSTEATAATAIPAALQPSAAVAAADLISSWASGNQARALSVATPSAVSTLFAGHYSSSLVIDRGCSVAFSPIVCSYGPPGGAAPTDPIYEIYVTQGTGGWYVSSARINS